MQRRKRSENENSSGSPQGGGRKAGASRQTPSRGGRIQASETPDLGHEKSPAPAAEPPPTPTPQKPSDPPAQREPSSSPSRPRKSHAKPKPQPAPKKKNKAPAPASAPAESQAPRSEESPDPEEESRRQSALNAALHRFGSSGSAPAHPAQKKSSVPRANTENTRNKPVTTRSIQEPKPARPAELKPSSPREPKPRERRMSSVFGSNPVRILDLYVLTSFIIPVFLCFFGFLAVWLIFDLSDNLPDFLDNKVAPQEVWMFYAAQVPSFALLAVPISLLLGALFALTRMSRTNELVSMISAGISIPRLLVPVITVGIISSLLMLWCNYELAPRAEAERELRLEAITSDGDEEESVRGLLFRNRFEDRSWYIERFEIKAGELFEVFIMQQDADHNPVYTLDIDHLKFEEETGNWLVWKGILTHFDENGEPRFGEWEFLRNTYLHGFNETPERILSANMNAETMTVPALRDYLVLNADQPDKQLAPYRTMLSRRTAWPFSSLVFVLIAAPLGIAFSRGGILSNVAFAIFLVVLMFFSREVFIIFGKAAMMPPWLAAWAPIMIFGGLGAFLLFLRATNRQLPKPNFTPLIELVQKQFQRKPAVA